MYAMYKMNSKGLVIDSNVWIDTIRVFTRLKEKTRKNYKEIWASLNSLIEENLSPKEVDSYRGAIDVMKRLLELSGYEILVPSFVYNEVGFLMSSKITSPSHKNTEFIATFEEFLNSMPLKTTVDRKELKEGEDYPMKNKTATIIESIMYEFLKVKQKSNGNLQNLVQYLSQADGRVKQTVQARTDNLKKLIADVRDKNELWDKPISDATKAHDIPYRTKTGQLNLLYNGIKGYPAASTIAFGPDSEHAIAKRLTMNKEEFDFFDLEIYLFAREKNAYIITMNGQAFQEINDPHFLGYFQDVNVMNPLINFITTADLTERSKGLIDIIYSSIGDDFSSDITTIGNFDKFLDKPLFHDPAKRTIDSIKTEYSRSKKDLKTILKDKPFGSAMEIFKFEDRTLKLSKKSTFAAVKGYEFKINVLRFVDKEMFKHQLSYTDFVIDGDQLKPDELKGFLNNRSVADKVRAFILNEDKNLRQFLEIFRTNDPTIKDYWTALYIESHFNKSDIENALHLRRESQIAQRSSSSSSRRFRKREITDAKNYKSKVDYEDSEGELTYVAKSSAYKTAPILNPTIIATLLYTMTDLCHKPFGYVGEYIKSFVPAPLLSQNKLQLENVNSEKNYYYPDQKTIFGETNVNNNNNMFTDVNSTLLLLDVVVRRTNDMKYAQPIEDYMLPTEELKKNINALTTKLGYGTADVVGSIENRHRQLLSKMSQ